MVFGGKNSRLKKGSSGGSVERASVIVAILGCTSHREVTCEAVNDAGECGGEARCLR